MDMYVSYCFETYEMSYAYQVQKILYLSWIVLTLKHLNIFADSQMIIRQQWEPGSKPKAIKNYSKYEMYILYGYLVTDWK